MLSRIVPAAESSAPETPHAFAQSAGGVNRANVAGTQVIAGSAFLARQPLRHRQCRRPAFGERRIGRFVRKGQLGKAALPLEHVQEAADAGIVGIRDGALDKLDPIRPGPRALRPQQAGKIVKLGGKGRDLGMQCHGQRDKARATTGPAGGTPTQRFHTGNWSGERSRRFGVGYCR